MLSVVCLPDLLLAGSDSSWEATFELFLLACFTSWLLHTHFQVLGEASREHVLVVFHSESSSQFPVLD